MVNKTTLKPIKIGSKTALLQEKTNKAQRQTLFESLDTEAKRKAFVKTHFTGLPEKAQQGLETILTILSELKNEKQ